MRLHGFRPLNKGEVSILAAFSLVVVLAAAGLFFGSLYPNNQESQTAATAASLAADAGTNDIGKAQKAAASEIGAKCRVAMQQLKASGKTLQSGSGKPVKDDCIASVKVPPSDPKYQYYLKLSGGYKCTGKDAKVQVQTDGTLTVTWNADPSVAPGTCKTFACDLNGVSAGSIRSLTTDTLKGAGTGAVNGAVIGGTAGAVIGGVPTAGVGAVPLGVTGAIGGGAIGGLGGAASGAWGGGNGGTCVPTSLTNGITKSDTLDALSSPDARSVYASGNALYLTNPASSWADGALLNQALGRNPLDNTGSIPLDAKGNLAPSANDKILEFAGSYQQDQGAQEAQQQATAAALNTNLGDKSVLTPSTGCTSNCGPAGGGQADPSAQQSTFGGPSSGSGLSSGATSFLGGLAKGLLSALLRPSPPAPASAQACATDPNAYAQQQQQYQQQLQQYNYQLQQYNYQQQFQQYGGNGGYSTLAPPPQPTPCTPSTQSQCQVQPPQPSPVTCTSGTWQAVRSGTCIVSWQCSNLGAQISCQPQTADVGMHIAIAYSCAQGTASGDGFTASGQSGTSTALVAEPSPGTNTVTYSLTCANGSQTSGAQCSVQVTTPTIILVANPATIHSGGTSLIGWITSGMSSCTVSSPDRPDFTAQNVSNTSVNGTAQTLAATTTASYLLHCNTFSGGTKDATTTVTVN